jgi:hypothetical protein
MGQNNWGMHLIPLSDVRIVAKRESRKVTTHADPQWEGVVGHGLRITRVTKTEESWGRVTLYICRDE